MNASSDPNGLMTYLAVASLAVNLMTLVGVYYAIKAVRYTKEQVDLLKAEGTNRNLWASKHAQAFSLVTRTNKWFMFEGSRQIGFPVVFSDAQFRALVETYIIQMDSGRDVMSPRVLDAAQFGLPVVQDVIQKSIETVERFKTEHPAEAHNLGLE
jgi:hypothetical protein